MLSPQLQIYNYVFVNLQGFGRRVIGIKDINEKLPYPFFMVQRGDNTKSYETLDTFSGNIDLLIHVYSLAEDEITHDELVNYADRVVSIPFELDGYHAIPLNVDIKTLIDSTTNDYLLHSIITAEFKVY